jgi:dihydroorotase-like cyclic amidohydrolase
VRALFDYKYQGKNPPYRIPGININSAFPLFYKQFVINEKIFTPEEAIQKISTMAARVHSLVGRGTLSEGSYALAFSRFISTRTVTDEGDSPKEFIFPSCTG